MTVNTSPHKKCWRLVFRDGVVKNLFESGGITSTVNNLFCGTKEECLGKIKELKLKYTPPVEEGGPEAYIET